MSSRRVACVIPALDAAPTLAGVVAGVRAAVPHALVIAVDDGSTDGTGEVATRVCDHVVTLPRNRGKGVALRAGFELALSLGSDVLLTIDADGQHDPRFAPAILAALDRADLVIGTRGRAASPMPIHRRASNALSSAAISWVAGSPVPDSQSGFRAMRAELARRIPATGDRYEYETEFLILAVRAGCRLATVPISTIYGSGSHFRPLRDSARVVLTIWRHRRRAD